MTVLSEGKSLNPTFILAKKSSESNQLKERTRRSLKQPPQITSGFSERKTEREREREWRGRREEKERELIGRKRKK